MRTSRFEINVFVVQFAKKGGPKETRGIGSERKDKRCGRLVTYLPRVKYSHISQRWNSDTAFIEVDFIESYWRAKHALEEEWGSFLYHNPRMAIQKAARYNFCSRRSCCGTTPAARSFPATGDTGGVDPESAMPARLAVDRSAKWPHEGDTVVSIVVPVPPSPPAGSKAADGFNLFETSSEVHGQIE